MQRGYFKKYIIDEAVDDYIDVETPIGQRRKTSRKQLQPDEIVQICYEAIVERQFHKDIAKKHNVNVALVAHYVCKAKKSSNFTGELYANQEKLKAQCLVIRQCILDFFEQGKTINKISDI